MKTFADDLRAILIPERKWHYIFHLIVLIAASAYWVGSLVKLKDASWAEITMYRPRGDNEIYPAIAALSRFNFGDPTDSLHYGEGTSASQAVILFPYAASVALFGKYGYPIADLAQSALFFVLITLLLRRCRFGNFSSLWLGAALTTRSLQILLDKVGESFEALLSISTFAGTWEWGFPNLLNLQIFVQRIPRPMVTELFVVLLLYFLVRQWMEQTMPSFRRGGAVGALLSLLLQGDPFSLSAIGLALVWVIGRTMSFHGWRVPWRFIGGTLAGALLFGSYFLWQQLQAHPDYAMRFGVFNHPRSHILPLPGYGPLLRVGVVCVLALLVTLASRRLKKTKAMEPSETPSQTSLPARKDSNAAKKMATPEPHSSLSSLDKDDTLPGSTTGFWVILVIAAWLAQPVQLFLLGKGCQIYHYLIFTLPSLYAYSAVILAFTFIQLATAPELPALLARLGGRPSWMGITFLSVIIAMGLSIGMENKLTGVFVNTDSRQETNVPWGQSGNLYRPCFRAMDKQFRDNPALQRTRTFATFCYEVNFLLAGFYDKRAFLPDNAYSTLSDSALEDRFCETLKILQFPPEQFGNFAQVNFVLNYWLGCAKYWMTSDHQYAPRADYPADQWALMEKQDKETPWMLVLPQSELQRLSKKYAEIFARESNHETHPDMIVVGLEKQIGMIPNPKWYREFCTNELFSVYIKK